MNRRKLLTALGANLFTAVTSSAADERIEKTIVVGETRVRLVIYESSMKSRRACVYFHPHENEHSSAVVTRHVIREFGGRLLEIRSQGEQLVTFKLKGKSYSFDPNRMFSDVGLESSLAHFAPMSDEPLKCARKLRDAVIEQLGRGKYPIVGVHNNSRDEFSIYLFQPGGMFSTQAAQVAINPKEKPQNFFLVLNPKVFSKLREAGFNVVLEAAYPAEDGSLGVYCQHHDWTYAAAEASEGDMNQQRRMLQELPLALR